MAISTSPALVVRLQGGLGNQLFEYCSANSIARRSGAPVYFDIESGFTDDRFGRVFELPALGLAGNYVAAAEASELARRSMRTDFLKRRELIRMRWLCDYFDPSLHTLRITRPLLMDNYLQSPRYFEDDATLHAALKTWSAQATRDSAPPPEHAVAVHVRRNLSVTLSGQRLAEQYFGAYPVEYYRECASLIQAEVPEAQFYCFGDDLDWIHDHVVPLLPACNIVESETHIEDFARMAQCRHFIIPNSTFSWWAAWIGFREGSIVCCGRKWNQGDRRAIKNLLPQNWRRIEWT